MSWQIYGKIAEKIVAEELCNDFFCYGDEENARIHAVHLTTANQRRDSQSESRLCAFLKMETIRY